jgi:hypothetical protein
MAREWVLPVSPVDNTAYPAASRRATRMGRSQQITCRQGLKQRRSQEHPPQARVAFKPQTLELNAAACMTSRQRLTR